MLELGPGTRGSGGPAEETPESESELLQHHLLNIIYYPLSVPLARVSANNAGNVVVRNFDQHIVGVPQSVLQSVVSAGQPQPAAVVPSLDTHCSLQTLQCAAPPTCSSVSTTAAMSRCCSPGGRCRVTRSPVAVPQVTTGIPSHLLLPSVSVVCPHCPLFLSLPDQDPDQ